MYKHIIGAAASAALVVGLAPSAQAAEQNETTLREGDVSFTDTRATGHNDLLRDGVHVYTEGTTSTDKAAGYFALSGTLADVINASMDWRNTPGFTAIPGQQIMFDADNIKDNGNDYNVLVGESVYGGSWWLTPASSQDAKDADPSGDNNGGNGSEWFGTLDEWATALPDSSLTAGGWSLGSGVHGDGILREMTYGDTLYTFTNKPEPDPEPEVARPVAKANVVSPKVRVGKVTVTATQRANTVPTKQGAYYRVIKFNPHTKKPAGQVSSGRVRQGSKDTVRVGFPKAKKWMQVRVISYGKIIGKGPVRVR